MMRRLKAYGVATALVAGSGAPMAHHGAAAYETEHLTTVAATVTAFEWKSPHALLRFDVADDDRVSHWIAEAAGLVILVRAGWRKDVLKPGDRITVIGRRARNGTHTMLLQRVVLPTGQELSSFIPPR